ncbi:MAG: IPT/TIG domain-containing protein, partial [Victivallaceae bacterium]
MAWVKKIPVLMVLAMAVRPGPSFAEFYLRPGDNGEFAFTVRSSSDSVEPLAVPQVWYPGKPGWFNIDNVSVTPNEPLRPGATCQIIVEYRIAENAPAGAENLKLKVAFSPNVYPPVWYPAASQRIVVDATPPLLSVMQPEWLAYSASTTVMPAEGMEKTVRGPGAGFYASDPESGIADFQIVNSSGENLSAGYFTQTSGGISYSGNFSEDLYAVTTLNKAGASTTGKLYIDYTPVVVVSSFTTLELSGGNYLDSFVLSARSHWGLEMIKLLPASFTAADPLNSAGFDSAASVREYNGGGALSAAFTFEGVPAGEYVLYAKDSLGSLSASPVTIHSATNLNPETGSYDHVVQYLNPDPSMSDDPGMILNFNGRERFVFHIAYDTVTSKGATFINSMPAALPPQIAGSYFTFPYGFGFDLKTSTIFSGSASVRVDYRQAPFTQAQQEQARLYGFVEGTGWVNITSGTGPGWVQGAFTALSQAALVFPYPAQQPYTAYSANRLKGEAEAELTSYFPVSALTAAATEQAPVSIYVSSAAASGKYQVSDMFVFAGAGTELVPPGKLKFRYSAEQLARIGVNPKTLSLSCAFNGPFETPADVVTDTCSITSPLSFMPYACGLFSTAKPVVPDTAAPESMILCGGPACFIRNGERYIGIDAGIGIYSFDPAQNGVNGGGVKATYFGVDVSSNSQASALNGEFSPFIIYTSTFNLMEGSHTVVYFAVDNAGNIELPKQTTVYIDYSSPDTFPEPGEDQFMNSEDVLYTGGLGPVAFNASDPEYEGAVSGIKHINILLDLNRDDCPPGVPYDTGRPFGTCLNPVYNAPFTVPGGAHTAHYWAEDNVGNIEDEWLQEIFVDTAAPRTSVYINGVLAEGLNLNIPQGSSITITAIDPLAGGSASGVRGVYVFVDTAPDTCGETGAPVSTAPAGTCQNPVYSGPLILSNGSHTVYYSAVDNVGNQAGVKTAYVNVGESSYLADITPSSGPIGLPFVITGAGFGGYKANLTTVLIGGTTAPITSWSTTTIKGTVPGALP